jgi:predicted negative regulator of RcsB-dependent stress response
MSSLLQRLTAATNDAEREAIVLEMSLSALSLGMKTAVYAAAIPHTFNALLLDALLDADSDDRYEQLVTLSFVQQVRGKGYALHDRTRQQLLQNLWRDDPAQFRAWSAAAAAYAADQASHGDAPHWEAEAIYHQLVSDPEKGLAGLQTLATRWANYEHHSYDEIERAVGLADEQITAGRLGGTAADWTRLWQAKLALLYNQPDRAAAPLASVGDAAIDPIADPLLAAEVAQTRGDWLWQQGEQAEAAASWQAAYAAYQGLPNGHRPAAHGQYRDGLD